MNPRRTGIPQRARQEALDRRLLPMLGAYEYLMRHFATESGKSKGQLYTAAEVSHPGAGDRHRARGLRTFDFAVANPTFNISDWSDKRPVGGNKLRKYGAPRAGSTCTLTSGR